MPADIKTKARRFNDWLALHVTRALMTMWCFYAFGSLSLAPIWWPHERDGLLYVSNCFQLVALPLLGVGTALLSQTADRQRQQDHDAIMKTLAVITELHEEVHEAMGLREGL